MFYTETKQCRLPAILAAAVALVVAIVFPATAVAATFTVNSTGDEADFAVGGGCVTGAGKCTLRAAIEAANVSIDGGDEIVFDGEVFEGQAADTIVLGSNLPAIVKPVRFDGGSCTTAVGVAGPCVALDGTNSGAALNVEADEVEIEGLAFIASSIGIRIVGNQDFDVRGNWFGVELDGTELEAGVGTSVLVGPGSSDGQIGGKEPDARNLFANGEEGIELLGASRVEVLGNRFGFAPDGTTADFGQGRAITIVSAPLAGFEAVDNVVGAHLDPAAAATPTCDGGCNTIAGAGYSIVLDWEGEQRGPAVETTVIGNQIGIDTSGTKGVASGDGIVAGESTQTTIGGFGAGDGNRINGGGSAIRGGGAELAVLGNRIGLNASGTQIMAPPNEAIRLFSAGLSSPAEEALVAGNEIGMDGGNGIRHEGVGATILDNLIAGAEIGVITSSSNKGHGSLIEANLIEGSRTGVMIENDFNELYGNGIFESSNGGVAIIGRNGLDATGNVIGGDSPEDENVIAFNGGDAIFIAGVEGSQNEVARNSGVFNEGEFIRLYSPHLEPVGPNGGIEPPEFITATQGGAEGIAEPGARIRVFRKESDEPGEIESFLGEDIANISGQWAVDFGAPIPGGTFIAATQTNVEGGTSELEFATTPGSPREESAGSSGSGGRGGGGGGNQADLTAPQTMITKAPKKKVRHRSVQFRFSSSEADSSFQCRLDGRRFRRCTSPTRYRRIQNGRHRFEVRAVDAAGNFDATPAKMIFTVLAR